MPKKSKSKDMEAKVEELTDDVKRIQAEFENFKKRTDKENKAVCSAAKAELVKKLLPVIDTFESALIQSLQSAQSSKKEKESSQNQNNNQNQNQGLQLVYSQLMQTLIAEGLTEIGCKGKFNTDCHEAMLQQESNDFGDEEIVQVLQKGYLFRGVVIRTAKVKINLRSDVEKKETEKESGEEAR